MKRKAENCMSFEAAKCPSCNASIQVPSDREKAVCMFCGNILVVKEAIQRLKVELGGPVVVDQNIETLLKSAHGFIQLEKWDEAKKKFDAVVELDSTDYRGWWGKFLVTSRNLTLSPRRLEYTEDPATCDTSDAKSAMKIVPESARQELEQKWAEYVDRVPKTYLLTINMSITTKRAFTNNKYTVIINNRPFDYLRVGEEIAVELFTGSYKIGVSLANSNPIVALPFYKQLMQVTEMAMGNKVIVQIDTDSVLSITHNWQKSKFEFSIKGGRIV